MCTRAHVRLCKCIYVRKIRRMRGEGNEWGERAGAGAGRARWSKRGPPGRNRMTERARGTIGGDDCQNRAARRYEKCWYLWHYFRRFELLFRPPTLSPPLPTRLANRSPVPLFPLPPALPRAISSPSAPNLLLCVPLPPPRSAERASFLLALLARPLASPTSSDPPHSTSVGAPHRGRTRTAGRFYPHRRGQHFNVTLIKSNNQYLPRKKF